MFVMQYACIALLVMYARYTWVLSVCIEPCKVISLGFPGSIRHS
jgi:hypothetical protein